MLRPRSIIDFERCYLGSLVLSFITLALTWNAQLAALQRTPSTAQLGDGFIMSSLLGGLAFGAVITLLLWWFAARRGSVVAKWIIVAFFALGTLGLLNGLARGTTPPGLGGVLSVANWVLQAVAVWLLFRPDANAWFADRGRRSDPAEPFLFMKEPWTVIGPSRSYDPDVARRRCADARPGRGGGAGV